MDLGIKGEIALVLGGTQGLGLACAQSLAEAGVRVVVNGRDRAKGEAVARSLGPETHFVVGDVSDPAERRRIFDTTRSIARPISILVTNAGGPPPGQFGEHDRETWLKAIETNMLAAIDMAERCLPDMVARGFRPHRQHYLVRGARAVSEPAAGELRSRRAARRDGDAGPRGRVQGRHGQQLAARPDGHTGAAARLPRAGSAREHLRG
jgi:NAD(P)-dependent dehydrogenase (short-subunit alcohol dehydrogenase family)